MTNEVFHEFYKSDLQSVYALCVLPLAFLAWMLFSRSAGASLGRWSSFLYPYFLVFAVETILDPVATGPFVRAIGAGDSGLGTAILLTFVLLGDFRVYLLIFRLAQMERPLSQAILEAAAWTLVVPIFAYASDSALHAVRPELPGETIWLIYELAFLSIALWLRASGIARRAAEPETRRRLESVAGYVAVYYALWATADVIVMGIGSDLGWALRVVPNQLYYAFFLPLVYFQFSSRR